MLLAVGEYLLDELNPQSLRIASAFAGGVGRTRLELCGALSGGAMVIGALYGRTSSEVDDKPALDLVARYRERFLEMFGNTQCAPLREETQAPGGPGTCALLVERAALLLLQTLDIRK